MLRGGEGPSPSSGRCSVQGNALVPTGYQERGRESSLPALSRSLPVSECSATQPLGHRLRRRNPNFYLRTTVLYAEYLLPREASLHAVPVQYSG